MDLARANFYSRNGKLVGWFRPTGALRPNRAAWTSEEPVQVARIFVGFNVGDEPRWTMQELVGMVREIRHEQHRDPGASFVAQKGLYAHKGDDGMIVQEDGAQILVMNLAGVPERAFERDIEQLASKLALEMRQEEVIVDFQKADVSYKTMGVVP